MGNKAFWLIWALGQSLPVYFIYMMFVSSSEPSGSLAGVAFFSGAILFTLPMWLFSLVFYWVYGKMFKLSLDSPKETIVLSGVIPIGIIVLLIGGQMASSFGKILIGIYFIVVILVVMFMRRRRRRIGGVS